MDSAACISSRGSWSTGASGPSFCELVLSRCDIFPVMPGQPVFDSADVAAHDMAASESVAMCMEYATAVESPFPFNQLRFPNELHAGFGPWHRLGQRATTVLEEERAANMLALLHTVMVEVSHRWHVPSSPPGMLERCYDIFAGGRRMRFKYSTMES